MKKITLITGGAQGIGLGIARSLAAEKHKLAICDIQPESANQQNIDSLRETGTEVLYCQADISSPDDRSRMIDEIKKKFGALNILVNNAGVAPKVRADLLDASEESYERVMKINLQGPYFLSQAIANWMLEQKTKTANFAGCIINVSSISATVASIGRGEYCISKAGMSMMTKLFAVRLACENIPVYEIRPGIIETPMTSVVKDKYDKLIAEGLLLQPRWGKPEDIGQAAAMLARGDIAYSTGQVINVDGGFGIERL